MHLLRENQLPKQVVEKLLHMHVIDLGSTSLQQRRNTCAKQQLEARVAHSQS
jgi:hypothetical protein